MVEQLQGETMHDQERPENIQEYLPQFFENRKKDCAKAKAALKQESFEDVARVGHAIKGVARPFGFPDLETMGLKLEEAGLSKDLNSCLRIVENIEKLVEEEEKKLSQI
jgi:HPt (histidine-containing phosphotransfer) domain-containing protein